VRRVLLASSFVVLAAAPLAADVPADSVVRVDRPFEGTRPLTLEVHAGAMWYGPGLAVGARFGIPLVHNGFVTSINNAVYLHLGADLYYARYQDDMGQDDAGIGFGVPLALHWEFYFDEKWSAFAELGVNIYFPASFLAGGDVVDRVGGWVLAAVGGKWHAGDAFAIQVSIGTPYTTFGAVFSF